MRKAWAVLLRHRTERLQKTKRPIPIQNSQRFVVVSESGTPLRKLSLDTAWQRLMAEAIRSSIIRRDEYFTLRGLKHRGITEIQGQLGDKQAGAGHVDQRMTARYSHDLVEVKPPG